MHNIRVSAVQLWSDLNRTPNENRQHALELAEQAAQNQPDLVVLPEAIAMLCYPDGRPDFSYKNVCEPVPGPTTEQLGAIARKYSTNIIAGLIAGSDDSPLCQNTTVVINREGSIVGRYDKVHEPEICRLEQAAGVGDRIPVFDLDFGRVGILVCWDLISPEIASILAYKGAKLICLPHLVGLPSAANFGVQIRARAIDAGVPVVAVGMRDEHNHNGSHDGIFPTCIIDANGGVVVQAESAGAEIISATVTLDGETANEKHIRRRQADLRFDVYAREYARLAELHSDAPPKRVLPDEQR